jgi:hypothetical protein
MREFYRIVETDNFAGDYPDEKFVSLPLLSKREAEKISSVINECLSGESSPRYWKVVEDGYELIPGFEP